MHLLLRFHIDQNHKFEIYVESKLNKASSYSIAKRNEPLDLINTNTYDLKIVQTREGKKIFFFFINDCTGYCYIYLLRNKGETLKVFKYYKSEVENDSFFDEFCFKHSIIHQTMTPYSL